MSKKEEVVMQPETLKIDGDVAIEATGEVTVNTPMERNGEPGAAKAMLDEDLPADIQETMDANAPKEETKPKTKRVKTGKNVMTGDDVFKDVAVKEEPDYSAGRKLFPIHTSVNGSYNGRRMTLVAGQSIYLNEKELKVFRNYVNGAGK